MPSSMPRPYRCPTCKTAISSVNPRNLAVFIDGTSNKPGPNDSNVSKLFSQVKSMGEGSQLQQRSLYLKGIGAYELDHLPRLDRVGKAIYSAFEMAFAWNAEKNVKEAYHWLVKTYREGDRIYLFGFSRGAYQVRTLASMIHEVGLVREEQDIDSAYGHYLCLDPYNFKTTEEKFKERFCWPGHPKIALIRDTVSSLGLIKRDVHLTSSASVTNACHFRHALALDERRVKFLPEYFSEVNAHRSNVRSPRPAVGDVKEVWFAGSHSDVGGVSRPHSEEVPNPTDDEPPPVHSGNVPLVWMRREAADKGLVFEPAALTWGPDDVDLGRRDTMKWCWKLFEVVRVRHQVSFSGTGKHDWRKHGFRPRSVIPNQQIHFSVLPGDVYAPRGTLASRVDIPTVPQQKVSGGRWPTEPWTTDLLDEATTTSLLASLLSDHQKTLKSLGEVLILLDFNNRQTRTVPTPQWLEKFVHSKQSGFNKFALTVIYDVLSNFSISEKLVDEARDALITILPFPDHLDFPRAVYVVRFSARHRTLRRRFIARSDVIHSLMFSLERIVESPNEDLFPLVVESLCYLIDGSKRRSQVVDLLVARLDGSEPDQTRLSLALEVKAPNHLAASLKLIASLAQHQPDHCEALKPRIIDLAKKGGSPVGPAAIEALVALKVQLPGDVHFSNILGYLGNTLPRLDVEIGSAPLPNDLGRLPPVLQVHGSGELDEQVMHRLVSTVDALNSRQRIAATLTLLKLSNNSTVRGYCLRNEVLDVFMRQLERRKTSLLAAYALMACLRHNMWTADDFPLAAQRIVCMIDKGWFDDAVGRIEGSKIFAELMMSDKLRREVLLFDIVGTLKKQLEGGNHHETRMGLICLEIIGRRNSAELIRIVTSSLIQLRSENATLQKKGVKVLSALAQTKAGEKAIMPHLIEIVKMLLPPPQGSLQSRSQLFGLTAAVYGLCKNETLRQRILNSKEYATFKRYRHSSTLYPKTRSKH
ncbi:Uncharacterized alpha/beta hydrolase domain (DUF2235) domain containing protein [Tylopilus felleus]